MGNDEQYIYGDTNGATYTDVTEGSDEVTIETQVHWDPRVEVTHHSRAVQIGVVPASDKSTPESGLWDRSEGQFLSLDRDGCNRLIRAVREARERAFGRDE